jgi:hypothetical protein
MNQTLHRIQTIHKHLQNLSKKLDECDRSACFNNTNFPLDFVVVRNPDWIKYYVLSDEVQWALAGQQPIVALESTVLTHGLPWPTNRTVAHLLESVVRQHHATPATIAVRLSFSLLGIFFLFGESQQLSFILCCGGRQNIETFL